MEIIIINLKKIYIRMAKIKAIEIIAGMSGKVCSHGDMYFATNKQTGKVYTAKLCNPYQGDPTPAQIAVRQKFAAKAKLVGAWMSLNRPSDAQPKGTELYQKVYAAFRAQHQVGNMFGFVSLHMSDDGKLNIATSASAGGGSSSGGGGTSGGDELAG